MMCCARGRCCTTCLSGPHGATLVSSWWASPTPWTCLNACCRRSTVAWASAVLCSHRTLLPHGLCGWLALTRCRWWVSRYRQEQIQEIVRSRLEGLDAFMDVAVEMAARKVASWSGDVRRALQICRYVASWTPRLCVVLVGHFTDTWPRNGTAWRPRRHYARQTRLGRVSGQWASQTSTRQPRTCATAITSWPSPRHRCGSGCSWCRCSCTCNQPEPTRPISYLFVTLCAA